MSVLNNNDLYYTRAFRRRDPDGTLQAEMEKLVATHILSSFTGKKRQEDFYPAELASVIMSTIIKRMSSRGKFFYSEPMLEAMRQVSQYLIAWRKTLIDQQMPGQEETEQVSAVLFMLVLSQLFPDYVIDHEQSPITILVEVVVEGEYAPSVFALITNEPCLPFAAGKVFSIFHLPCMTFGEKEENLLKGAKAEGTITTFHVIDVSDAL